MSFMMEIDEAYASQHSPLDTLVTEYFRRQKQAPSLDFCRRLAGIPDADELIARRLGVAIAAVRDWREIGHRAASKWTCR
jgi:hypothetical protein